MNLLEFKNEVDRLVNHAIECGEPLEEIRVSVQVEGTSEGTVYSDEVELHYDNNCNTSGFVIRGFWD